MHITKGQRSRLPGEPSKLTMVTNQQCLRLRVGCEVGSEKWISEVLLQRVNWIGLHDFVYEHVKVDRFRLQSKSFVEL